MKKNILALDIATVTGWAWSDGTTIEHGLWDLRRAHVGHEGEVYANFENRLYDFLDRRPVDKIWFEELLFADKSLASVKLRTALRAYVVGTAAKNQIAFDSVAITTLKHFATGNGHAGKPEMVHACRCKLGFDVSDHNEVDALWVLHYGQAEHVEKVKAVKKRRERKAEPQQLMF